MAVATAAATAAVAPTTTAAAACQETSQSLPDVVACITGLVTLSDIIGADVVFGLAARRS
jgi:hypothetical protein